MYKLQVWNDLGEQSITGIILFKYTDASINTDALCTTRATSLGTTEGANPTQIEFWLFACDVNGTITYGLPQVGQRIQVDIDNGDIDIDTSNYIIDVCQYDGVSKMLHVIATNGLVFDRSREQAQVLPQQNSQLIQQIIKEKITWTEEGGLAIRLTNETGLASVKGTIVEADSGVDNAFDIADASSNHSIGVVYEDGIVDGAECLIVISGRCQVLLKDATLSTRGNWVKVSDVAGRADATGGSPAAAPTHFLEIGHCLESKGADTDVLAYCTLHYL